MKKGQKWKVPDFRKEKLCWNKIKMGMVQNK